MAARHAVPNLADDTRRRYLEVWGAHLLDRLGGFELWPDHLSRRRRSARPDDPRTRTGADATQDAHAAPRHPSTRRRSRSDPREPSAARHQTEAEADNYAAAALPAHRIRSIMLEPRRRIVSASHPGQRRRRAYQAPVSSPQDRWRNALIVSMLAYAGLRPIEDRGSRWGDLDDRTLHVMASKTGRARDIDLLAPLAQDLAEWRLMCGRPSNKQLIVPRPTGGDWSREDWANWRRRIWRPAAIAAGVTADLRPYRLRGSFVSLLLWEGRSLAYPNRLPFDRHICEALRRGDP